MDRRRFMSMYNKEKAFQAAVREFEYAEGIFSFACFSCVHKDENDIYKCNLLEDEVCEDMENWRFDYDRFLPRYDGLED